MRYLTLGEVVELHRRVQEPLMLDLAAGRIDRTHLIEWLRHHLRPLA